MFARMNNGVVAEVFDGSRPVWDPVRQRTIRYRHLENWHQLPEQNNELTIRNFVKVTDANVPAHDTVRFFAVRVPCQVGAAEAKNTWRLDPVPRAQVIRRIKDRAAQLFWQKFDDFAVNNTDWLNYRTALRTRGQELVTAYDAGTAIDITAGSIAGAGGWPA